MADDSRDDADNEITRIVRRPGPAQLPINILRPQNPAPPAGNDAIIPAPPVIAPANDSVPPVAPPSAFDRPRPVMTPPPRSPAPPAGAMPQPPVPPAPGAPNPVVIRPSPAASVETRVAPIPAPIASPEPAKVQAPVLSLSPVDAPQPVAVPIPQASPAPIEAAKPIARPAPVSIAAPPAPAEPVVGWLVVVKGPGRGTAREMVAGRNAIGRSSGQAIRLDFGDPAIAPEGHAYMVYDDEARAFFVEDGKQKVVVRLNGKLLTETMPIHHGDNLRIGATTLRFVALCGPDFDWTEKEVKVADAETPSDVMAEDDIAGALVEGAASEV